MDHSNLVPEAFQRIVRQLSPVYQDFPLLRFVKAVNQLQQRALPFTALSHKGNPVPRVHLQADLLQHHCFRIPEGNISKAYAALPDTSVLRRQRILLHLPGQKFLHPPYPYHVGADICQLLPKGIKISRTTREISRAGHKLPHGHGSPAHTESRNTINAKLPCQCKHLVHAVRFQPQISRTYLFPDHVPGFSLIILPGLWQGAQQPDLRQPHHHFLYPGIRQAHFIPYPFMPLCQFSGKIPDGVRHHRRHDNDRQAQEKIRINRISDRNSQLDEIRQHIEQATVNEFQKTLRVILNSLHHVPAPDLRQNARLQAQQMFEALLTDIRDIGDLQMRPQIIQCHVTALIQKIKSRIQEKAAQKSPQLLLIENLIHYLPNGIREHSPCHGGENNGKEQAAEPKPISPGGL